MRPGDRFRIISTSKTFVATVVLQLAGEGRLSLNDTVEDWLPGVVSGNGNEGGTITVRQLLQHTSGLFNYRRTSPHWAAWTASRRTGTGPGPTSRTCGCCSPRPPGRPVGSGWARACPP
ncbi:serine hydrolase domain-containing protein [Streptomyces sp. NPDC000851]